MLALAEVRAQEKADQCPMCGLPRAICQAKETEQSVSVSYVRCHVATAISRYRRSLDDDETFDANGVEFVPSVANPLTELLPQLKEPRPKKR